MLIEQMCVSDYGDQWNNSDQFGLEVTSAVCANSVFFHFKSNREGGRHVQCQ